MRQPRFRSLVLLLALGASPALAQRAPGAVLLGRVVVDSTKQPVGGAEVIIPSLTRRTVTDSLGRFRLDGIAPGRRGLRVNRIGYAPLRTAVEFSAGDTVELEIGISPSTEEMAAIEIVEAQNSQRQLLDFERRRATGTGEYLTAEDIRIRSRGRLSEALRTLGGVSVLSTASGVVLVGARASGRGIGTCYTAVMLDNVWVYDGDRTQTPFNVNSLNPEDIAAIEYYRGLSNTPVELQGIRNSCGVLVIWTKF